MKVSLVGKFEGSEMKAVTESLCVLLKLATSGDKFQSKDQGM